MPRANRYFVPGRIWHLTHRCHKREFLLKFIRDRRCWERWLFEARKRFGLKVLNYVVTSNHVHLLVYGGEEPETIPRSMQLIAGRTGQAYNLRKQRKGAYWEDRYHATAVEGGEHFSRCMAYIDMNMVRAGAVGHPAEWTTGGFHEVATPPQRYARIDRDLLAKLLGLARCNQLAEWQRESVDTALKRVDAEREPEWTEGIAVGSGRYVEEIQKELGVRARHRIVQGSAAGHVLREPHGTYSGDSDPKTEPLSPENRLPWDLRC